jgi:hypothetical protein
MVNRVNANAEAEEMSMRLQRGNRSVCSGESVKQLEHTIAGLRWKIAVHHQPNYGCPRRQHIIEIRQTMPMPSLQRLDHVIPTTLYAERVCLEQAIDRDGIPPVPAMEVPVAHALHHPTKAG